MTFSYQLSASEFEKVCKSIPNLQKGVDIRTIIDEKKFQDIKLANPTDAKNVISKLKEKNWLVIDTRDKNTRRSLGGISNTLYLVSDPYKLELNQFTKKNILVLMAKNKTKKHLKNRHISNPTDIDSLKNVHFIVFCNGYKCHSSTFAACQLRKFGIPFEKIYILLGGFDELVKAGAPKR